MIETPPAKSAVGRLVEVLLPLLLLAGLVAACLQLLMPFVGLLLWTIILAICFYPLHRRLTARRMSNRWSAVTIGVALTLLILIPTAIASISAAASVPAFVSSLKDGTANIPPPPASLDGIPIVGPKINAGWTQASNNFPAF